MARLYKKTTPNKAKMKRLFIVFSLIFSLSVPAVWAQSTSTQGKEFWLSFMHNGFRDHTSGGWVINQVLISAKRNCSGTISNPNTGWSQEFTVNANNITTIEIPEQEGYHNSSQYESIMQKGLKVQSSDTISVYCTNIAYVSFDASFVLPVESLGDEYIIQSYDQSYQGGTAQNAFVINNETSAFLIVATENNTVVDITPTCATLAGHLANETFSVTLNAGETYHVRSTRTGNQRDLSGTRVLAADCKRIAVFNGNTLTCIPINQGNGFDHIFEQAMPLRSWGKNFVVTSSMNRNRDFIKITSSANDNEITKNGEVLVTLNANQSYTFAMAESERSCFLQATQPSAVYLFDNSSYDQSPLGGLGDPSMVWIAPVEQRIDEVTFSTFDHPNIEIETHSVNIIVNTEDIAQVFLDGEQISPLNFSRVNGNNDYSFARLSIEHGRYHLYCPNGFNAHVYGFGDAKGYAYLVGSNAKNLNTNLSLNGETMLPNESFSYCANQPITFNANVNFQEYNLLWDFGDGTTSTQNPVVHTYQDSRVYHVALSVSTDQGGCTGTSSDTTYFFVDATQQYIIENDQICAGELYTGHGFTNVRIETDTILARLEDNPIHPECKDSLLVYIDALPQYHIPIDDSRCWQGTPSTYNSYGFSFIYDQPGTYDRQLNLQTASGCDSVIMLHLTVADRITHEFSIHDCTGSYVWDGQSYTTSGDFVNNYVSAGGCDSIVTMHLTIGHAQQTSFDTITCSTFHWNGQDYTQSGTYTQVFDTYDGCDSTVVCHLTLSGNVEGTTTSVAECDSFEWLGTEYTVSGQYSKALTTDLGCDSTVYLNLDLDYTPTPTPIYPLDTTNTTPHWVVTATEFQINTYDYCLSDENPDCEWDNVVWSILNDDVDWVLEPFGENDRNCKLYVLNRVEDTVWLSAKVFNSCETEAGIERRYWLVCSFYGVDENQAQADFTVTPNPNNGQMTLGFEHLGGKLEMKVYDVRGVLIDEARFFNAADSYSTPYTCPTIAKGLHFFVVTGKDGSVARKVLVQ